MKDWRHTNNILQVHCWGVELCKLCFTHSWRHWWRHMGLALLTLSWDKNWDSHSLMNGYPSFYLRIALALLTLSWDKNWDSHSLMNGYPSFYLRIALVTPSPDHKEVKFWNRYISANIWARASIKNSKYRKSLWLSFGYIQLPVSLPVKKFVASSKWRPFWKF